MVQRKKASPAAEAAAQADPTETRQQILYAAAHLFRDQGYAMTTLRQIADATGIKAGSIYYHFASKDDMLLEVLEVGMKMVTDGVKERVTQVAKDRPARERIEAAIHGHLFGLLVHGDFTTANTRIYTQVPESIKRRHRPSRRAYARYWDSVLEDACSRGELRADMDIPLLRQLVLGALNWTVEWYDAAEHGDVDKFGDHVTSLIFDGILTGGRTNGSRALRKK